jgi:hypothetical protein
VADDSSLRQGQVLTGSLFGEPVRVVTVSRIGPDSWNVGNASGPSRSSAADIKNLQVQEPSCSYAGDCNLLRLGLQAYVLGIAYEFDLCVANY